MQGLFGQDEGGELVVSVAFDSPVDQSFDYYVPEGLAGGLKVGQRVAGSFGRGNRGQVGFAVGISDKKPKRALKAISKIVDDEPLLSGELLELGRWISEYYCCPLGTVLAGMVPGPIKKRAKVAGPRLYGLSEEGREALAGGAVRLGAKQRAVLETLRDSSEAAVLGRSELLERSESSTETLRNLIRKGLVRQLESAEAGEYLSANLQEVGGGITRPGWELNAEQREALERLRKVIAEGEFGVHLLHGVTGSGKTEVYIRCIEEVGRMGKQAIVLVPEITLTTQMVERFRSRLPGVCVLHSGLTGSQRRGEWLKVAAGQGRVVVGPRSAVFAPTKELGLIVVDEEHEPSYKQDTQPRYHGRDVAIKRGQLLGVPVILGSATPSLESLLNSQRRGYFSRIQLGRRVQDLPLPKIEVVDLREEYRLRKGVHILSRKLEKQLERTLGRRHQAILLLNRRGYAGFVSCPKCEYVLRCEHCDVTLTYHRRSGVISSGRVLCHYCLSESRVPKGCPTCGEKLIMLGVGTQRAEQELARKFPEARFARVDSDSMTRQMYEELLGRFGRRELDILLGTQMIAKGLDFPRVELVGILSADTSLSIPDFRSSERTFQLAAQVAGRAGRASPGALVVMQTFNPDFPAIRFATEHDYEGFARMEMSLRKSLGYPPFGRMTRIVMRSESLEVLGREAERASLMIERAVEGVGEDVKVQGPLPPPIARISGQHRVEFVLRAGKASTLQGVLNSARAELFKLPVQVVIDVDPMNLM